MTGDADEPVVVPDADRLIEPVALTDEERDLDLALRPRTLGEFHGVIAPTTPTGMRRIIDNRPLTTVGTSEPYGCHGKVDALRISP